MCLLSVMDWTQFCCFPWLLLLVLCLKHSLAALLRLQTCATCTCAQAAFDHAAVANARQRLLCAGWHMQGAQQMGHLLAGWAPWWACTTTQPRSCGIRRLLAPPPCATGESLWQERVESLVKSQGCELVFEPVSGQSWPPVGWLGTVVGLYDNAAEIVWDQETAGASTLCNR